jgi:chromosome segregation ATPase
MNEFDDGCSLTTVIKAREAAIANLKAKLEESEEHYVSLQEAYNKKLTEANGLEAQVRSLENNKIRMNEETNYWRESYKEVRTRADIQEGVYLKIIRELSNRD